MNNLKLIPSLLCAGLIICLSAYGKEKTPKLVTDPVVIAQLNNSSACPEFDPAIKELEELVINQEKQKNTSEADWYKMLQSYTQNLTYKNLIQATNDNSKNCKNQATTLFIYDMQSSKQDYSKYFAYSALANSYFYNNEIDKLLQLFQNSNGEEYENICLFLLNPMANNLYDKKEYEKAFLIYKAIGERDKTGETQYSLAWMYVKGLGISQNTNEAIYWYQLAVPKITDPDQKAEALNNMAVAYELTMNYLPAFQNYQKAAEMGFALAQLNLGKLYAEGHGTPQDNKQAFAWVSTAISKGLGDATKQDLAEKTKEALVIRLAAQDQTGKALEEAEDLGKQYYYEYVLHENPTTNKEKSISARINAAIEAFNS